MVLNLQDEVVNALATGVSVAFAFYLTNRKKHLGVGQYALAMVAATTSSFLFRLLLYWLRGSGS